MHGPMRKNDFSWKNGLFVFGTQSIENQRVLTPDGRIVVEPDARCEDLTRLGHTYAVDWE